MKTRTFAVATSTCALLAMASLPVAAQSTEPAYVGFETPRGGFVNVDFLYMTRNTLGPFTFYDNNTQLEIVSSNDLNWSWSPGVQLRAGGTIGDSNLGFLVGGFWLSPMQTAIDETFAELSLAYREDAGLKITVNGVDGLEGEGWTSVHGAEANLFFQLSPDVSMYAGAAYIGLSDTLELVLEAGGDITSNWYTTNRMVGPQIGGRVSLGGTDPGDLFLTTDFRGGILFNAATHQIVDNGFAGNSLTEGRSTVMMLGAQLTAGYQVTQGIAFNFGYQALWLKNVTLADENDGLGADDAFLMHGAQMGLTLGF